MIKYFITLVFFFTCIQAQVLLDEIEILLNKNEDYVFIPQKINKNDGLWYSDSTDELFTGRIAIYSLKTKSIYGTYGNFIRLNDPDGFLKDHVKVMECTIINGVKNGYFTQYFNSRDMLPGIMGLYVNDKREGNWTWLEPEQVKNNRSWKDLGHCVITQIDYRNGLKDGSILIHRGSLHQYPLQHNYEHPLNDIIAKGFYQNDEMSGEWLFYDNIISDYDNDIESDYSDDLLLHWTRKKIYENDEVIDNECREPWDRHLDCKTYMKKYSNKTYIIADRDNYVNKAKDQVHDGMATVFDSKGNEVTINIIEFMQHINEFHSSNISIHKERGYEFTINENFRRALNEQYWK